MDRAKAIEAAETALQDKDHRLGQLILRQGPIVHEPRADYFLSLARSIIGQQVSVASAAAIFSRLQNETNLDPTRVAGITDEQSKTIGLSRQKRAYLADLAQHFIDDPVVYDHLEKLTDEEVIADLTKVKGVGIWTAEMFLMFTLSRLDVFAPDDIGLQRAMKLLYGWKKVPPRAELEKIADDWRPYRTVASWHLWKSLHNTPQ